WKTTRRWARWSNQVPFPPGSTHRPKPSLWSRRLSGSTSGRSRPGACAFARRPTRSRRWRARRSTRRPLRLRACPSAATSRPRRLCGPRMVSSSSRSWRKCWSSRSGSSSKRNCIFVGRSRRRTSKFRSRSASSGRWSNASAPRASRSRAKP
ncbi:MAG: FIG00802367: hypothetical protein, partial [uncultured Microvirga sp.]